MATEQKQRKTLAVRLTETTKDIQYSWIAKLNATIMKIQKNWICIPLLILTNILYFSTVVGAFVLPFISIPWWEWKIVASVVIGAGEILFANLVFPVAKGKTFEGIVSRIITIVFCLGAITTIHINTNFYHIGNWVLIAIVLLFLYVGLLLISSLIVMIKKEQKIALPALGLSFFAVLLLGLLNGAITVDTVEQNVRIWCGCLSFFGLVSIIGGFFLTIFFQKTKVQNIIYYALAIIGAIIILFFVAWLINYFDNSVSFLGTFITLLAAALGGALTLFGVAWTIKHTEKQRQDEERKKYKPFVNLYHPTEEETIKAHLICCCKFEEGFFNKKEKDAYLTEIESFLISNTDFSSFHVMGFKFNDKLVRSKSLMYIDKNSFIRVSFSQFYSSMEIKEFSMWILDGLGNIYEVDFSLKREKVALENGCIYNKIMVTGNRFPKLRQENWNEF